MRTRAKEALGIGTALVLMELAASSCAPRVADAPRLPGDGRLARPVAPAERLVPASPSRFVPDVAEEPTTFGLEPDGRDRLLVGGLRVLARSGGAIAVADLRLPESPSHVLELPSHLGGGFLFLCGATLHRSDTWLGETTPLFTSPAPVLGVVKGLDRIYVRTANAFMALDPRSGDAKDLGPFPPAPSVTGFAAADGWRAAAIADLRGLVATTDAGASWHDVPVPIDPRDVFAAGGELSVGGYDTSRRIAWYALGRDGGVARLAGAPEGYRGRLAEPASGTSKGGKGKARASDASLRASSAGELGQRPLAAAIEDGWPLEDGTALVARDGALARVRLGDGELVELARGAFPESPARCHPVSLATPAAPSAFGFVCGEPRGKTAIYAYDASRGALVVRHRFASPRVVSSSGNGMLVVRGPCADDAASARAVDVARVCVLAPTGPARDVTLAGSSEGARVVALTDGRLVVLTPPPGARGPARLTVHEGGRSTTVAVSFPRGTPDVARALAYGVWLDGFEERRPGVLGGWLEAGGAMLGIELGLDGRGTPGELVRDAGMPFVAGRFGFGFGGARRGYETTDGGMTWKPVEVPEPLVGSTPKVRAVSALGAAAAGWLRVGWGARPAQATPPIPSPRRSPAASLPPQLSLLCEPEAPAIPTPKASPAPPHVARTGVLGLGTTFGGGPPVLAPRGGTAFLPPFFAHPPPALRDGERGESFEIVDLPDGSVRLGALARIYLWGSRAADWDQGQAEVRWLSPFAGWPESAGSAVTAIPPAFAELVKPTSGWPRGTGSLNGVLKIATGDDPSRALLFVRRPLRNEMSLFELEAERPPVPVQRADGEPFSDIDGVVRASGLWIVATTRASADRPPGVVTTIWRIDGQVARELASFPRAADANVRVGAGRLARRGDGRAVGYVVDGQATAERSVAVRWVVGIDLETGAVSAPEPVGYADLAGRPLAPCAGDAPGWVLDAPLGGVAVRTRTAGKPGSLHGVLARLRLTGASACLENLAGTYDGQTPERARDLVRTGPRPADHGPGLTVVATSREARYPLRCTPTP